MRSMAMASSTKEAGFNPMGGCSLEKISPLVMNKCNRQIDFN